MLASSVLAAVLTVNDIIAQHPVTGTPPTNVRWAPNGSAYVYSLRGEKEDDPAIMRIHDMRSGADRNLFRAKAEQRGTRSRPVSEVVWSHDSRSIALINAGALETIDPASGRETTLAQDADDPQWSPDDRRIAYVHENDLYDVNVATHAVQRLTFDGSDKRINGDPDWLYSEEMNVEHAFAWSPDNARIAYLSFDESPIQPFPIQNYLPKYNAVEEQLYPLAGAKNARVSLNVVDVASARSTRLYDGGPHDEYVLSFSWSPNGSVLLDQIMDRGQKHLRWIAFERNGRSRTVVSESDPKFVDVEPIPEWSNDGRSIYLLSQRGGRQQLWQLNATTGRGRRISGDYTIKAVLRVSGGFAYVDAYYPTRRDRSFLRLNLADGSVQNLTPHPGVHNVTLADDAPNYIDAYSSFDTTPTIVRATLDGRSSTELFRTPDLSRFDLGTVKAVSVPSQWGDLDGTLVVPKDFDPSKRYPVIFTPYGGPLGIDDNETVDRWPGLYPFLLAQHGFLVFTMDGPASQIDRASAERMFYLQMGKIAMAGQLAGVDWMKKQPFADPSRLGLMGWSYGGYLTAFTMTHAPGAFHSAIAGAPPADWQFYDTAYTERYMGMPQHEAQAYRETSVLPAAGRLQDALLILQGTSDDNVHLMNSISLIDAFMHAGKHVDYFVYPGERHGPRKLYHVRDLYSRMLDWWEKTLK